MIRNYPRKTTRGDYGNERLRSALNAVQSGMPLSRASREFGVPRRTIRRHKENKVSKPGTSLLGGQKVVLPEAVESELVQHIQIMEKSVFGLSSLDNRRLGYEIAEKMEVTHPSNKEKKTAGKDWFHGFMRRHPQLTVRLPQGTSISRALGFNASSAGAFFFLLTENCLSPTKHASLGHHKSETWMKQASKTYA